MERISRKKYLIFTLAIEWKTVPTALAGVIDAMKHSHEFRDPIHTFISVRSDERRVIDSRPFQRLREIHQLALTYLLYPGATHKRFEHSLGVMELAGRIFDTVTNVENIKDPLVRDIIPDADALRYWRTAVRMAALCHDTGHLPFSHAAEKELLPEDYSHEDITVSIIHSEEMCQIWESMTPPLRARDIAKLAVGQKEMPEEIFSTWESILSEIVVGDAFGADRMDYLLRDSYHAGVTYGRFDHNRLISSLRILRQNEIIDEPALGLEIGGLEASEALMLARYFIYKQVYLHHTRRAYDLHLIDFLKEWLSEGVFSVDPEKHILMTDVEVMTAIRAASHNESIAGHVHARRIRCREHFRALYFVTQADKRGGILKPGKVLFEALSREIDPAQLKYDYVPPKAAQPDFPVLLHDQSIVSSLQVSQVLPGIPVNELDSIYCSKESLGEARKVLARIKPQVLGLAQQGELFDAIAR